ncbi:MAG: methyltransferase domain-containing protein [Dehalococcoidia bacterium]|nr:methyltransferase domain-containing protein [Dehalococcoidia bacterium]
MSASPFQPSFFERLDERADPIFYEQPRLLVHIDDDAIEAARRLYRELLPEGGDVLDLMSSYRSHMPPELCLHRLAGLGLNEVEMRKNNQLTDFVVHDLNADPRLPYDDRAFDGAVVTVSVQYMTRPVDTFREVRRVLKPDAPLIITYSNRMFPTKAVSIWRALDDRERAVLIRAYFREAGGFGEVAAEDRSIGGGPPHDPLYAVWARRGRDDDPVAKPVDPV